MNSRKKLKPQWLSKNNIKNKQSNFQYLLEIYLNQGHDDKMWPYDLAKYMNLSEDILQECRKNDKFYKYKRQNPSYEYNYLNYIDLPKYDLFFDFLKDDYEVFQDYDNKYYYNSY